LVEAFTGGAQESRAGGVDLLSQRNVTKL
jgi:hypothetical protein